MAGEPKAKFRRGKPTNLPAAALDAYEWLVWFQGFAKVLETKHVKLSDEYSKRLDKATRELREHLKPHLPLENEK